MASPTMIQTAAMTPPHRSLSGPASQHARCADKSFCKGAPQRRHPKRRRVTDRRWGETPELRRIACRARTCVATVLPVRIRLNDEQYTCSEYTWWCCKRKGQTFCAHTHTPHFLWSATRCEHACIMAMQRLQTRATATMLGCGRTDPTTSKLVCAAFAVHGNEYECGRQRIRLRRALAMFEEGGSLTNILRNLLSFGSSKRASVWLVCVLSSPRMVGWRQAATLPVVQQRCSVNAGIQQSWARG